MITGSPHQYLRVGLQLGHDREVVARALAAAEKVESSGLSSVLTLKHLAWQTGASYLYLRQIVQRVIDPYSDIRRRRRNGVEMRRISAPDPPLMSVQRWLLGHIVSKLNVHPASSAYMTGNSIAQCAQRHLGASWLIKMDVHDFFHSIDERQIFSVFLGAGYSRLVSLELARICTRGVLGPLVELSDVPRYTIASYRTTRLGALPQGGPTSGPLANVVMFECDKELNSIAQSYDMVYTRYADDIVFSASADIGRDRAHSVVRQSSDALRVQGLRPHGGKTRICPPGSRHTVLGLLVDGDAIRLRKETRQQIESHIRGVRVFGLREHGHHRGFASTFGLIHHVSGLLAFAHDVDSTYAQKKEAEWRAVLLERGWSDER